MPKQDAREWKVGGQAEFEVAITDELVTAFAHISGDRNALHMNDTYAKATPFGRRVVHGMLLGSFFSRLVGMHLPGESALYLSQSLLFRSPVFIDDILRVRGVVTQLVESVPLLVVRTTIERVSDGVLCVEGEARVKVRK